MREGSYSRDNSVIYSVRRNLWVSLRPRCWTRVSFRCSGLKGLVCSTINTLRDLSSGRRELGRFLSLLECGVFCTKGILGRSLLWGECCYGSLIKM